MRKSLLYLLLLASSTAGALAQQKQITVSGVVIASNDREPVIAASVVATEHPKVGVLTDTEGKFSFKVPAGTKSLTVSSIGYSSQRVNLTGQPLHVTLRAEERVVDNVVVVAYGRQSKNSFTGSAARVSVEELNRKSTSNLTTALQGASPGVQVFTTTGQPGANATVQIRGIGSVNSNTAPLYVVDGVPYELNLGGLNLADVESMTVLKDASATALYGARAANGVVLITTRQGQAGKITFDAELKAGINKRLIPLYDVINSPEDFLEVAYQSVKNKYEYFGLKNSLASAYSSPRTRFADGKSAADAPQSAADLLFFDGILASGADAAASIPSRYKLWDLPSGQLIDAQTGRFNRAAKRLYTPERWEDELFRTGQFNEANLRISGGNDKIRFASALGFQKNVGYYVGSDFKRLSLRNNLTANLSKDLKATIGLSYANTTTNDPGQGTTDSNGFQWVYGTPSIFPVFQHDPVTGKRVPDPKLGGADAYDFGEYDGVSRPFRGGINPAGSTRLDKQQASRDFLTSNISLEYRFLQDFKLAINYGLQFQAYRQARLANPLYGDSKNVGSITQNRNILHTHTLNQILSWGRAFGDHHLDAFIAHESSEQENDLMSAQRKKVVKGNVLDLNDGLINESSGSYRLTNAIESYFGQLRYDYDNRYYLSASLRRDGSSRFAEGNRWGTFGSVGAAWIASRESFLSSASWINNLKFKASYGVLGNQDLSLGYSSYTPDYYLYTDLYDLTDAQGEPSFSFYSKGNPNLSWELSHTFNIGLESRLLDRLEFNLDFFIKKTSNMLFNAQTPPSLGYSKLPVNDGELSNRGLELELRYEAIKTKNVELTINANGGYYANRIDRMSKDPATDAPKHYEIQGSYAYKQGHSLRDFYLRSWRGVNDKGLPQWKSYTQQVDGKDIYVTDLEKYLQDGGDVSKLTEGVTTDYSSAVREFVGKSAIPNFVGGFGFDLRVQRFRLSTSFTYGLGGYGLDLAYAGLMKSGARIGETNYHKDILNSWTPENKGSDLPILASDQTELRYVSNASTRFLTSRSFLNLTNARISYDVPKALLERAGIGSATVYLSGDNLFLLTARRGYASMSSTTGSSSAQRYLPVSSIVAGVQLHF